MNEKFDRFSLFLHKLYNKKRKNIFLHKYFDDCDNFKLLKLNSIRRLHKLQ